MNYLKKAAVVLPILLIMLGLFFYFGFSKPDVFAEEKYIHIEKGTSLLKIGEKLKDEGVIRSKTVFVVLEKIASAEKSVKAGDYFFKEPVSVFDVVVRLFKGDFGIEQRKIIIREGETVWEISQAMEDFVNFDKEKFMEIAGDLEGYLFPDTYFLFVNITAEELIAKMRKNFDEKIKTIAEEIENSDKSFSDILIMASIIEKEVISEEDRAIVSGLLWKRISKGMALQVDATLGYVTGKTSAQLTVDDLKSASLYNTYTHQGLTPTPICNPGLDAIKSALRPKDSPYYFYLTGRDGKTYFAKTFDEHKANKTKYLR